MWHRRVVFPVRCQLKFGRSFRNKNDFLYRDHNIRSVCLSALPSSRGLISVHKICCWLLISIGKEISLQHLVKRAKICKNRISGNHILLKAVNWFPVQISWPIYVKFVMLSSSEFRENRRRTSNTTLTL